MADANDDSYSEEFLNTPFGETPPEPTSAEPVTPAQEPVTNDKSEEAEPAPATEEPKEDAPASAETEGEPEPTKQDTTPQTADDRRREQARQGWQQRQRIKEAEQNFDKSYQPKTTEDLTEEGLDPRDARIQALELQRQFDQERAQVIQLTADMTSDSIEIENDFDIFNPKSDNYDKEFTEGVMADYKLDAHLEVDENNNILRADRPLYDYFQRRYDSYNRGLSKGSIVSQQNHQEMLARTENPGGSSSQAPSDPSKMTSQELLEKIGDQPLFG